MDLNDTDVRKRASFTAEIQFAGFIALRHTLIVEGRTDLYISFDFKRIPVQ